ncbi:MAG: hypothetical protein OEY44_04870, partial [Candidatus Peregrinibacteria bacterium]|nr:hypothetical protein [Candidatus Peregrinibacteria bacterium]
MPSLEAQVVNIADEIAYQSHDIDDGLRSGILSLEALMGLDIFKAAADGKRYSDVAEIQRHHIVTSIMKLLVNDLAKSTDKLVREGGFKQVEDIYAHTGDLAQFSAEVKKMAAQLKDYLYENFYNAPEVMKYNNEGKEVIRILFHRLYDQPALLPEKYQVQIKEGEKHELIKDYIAGMTDSFALELYESLK